ncbi:putative nucleic acid-binding, OB-fold protein [Tanacetum coccineum]
MGGRGGRIAECLIGDETETILFTARNDQVDLMKSGNVGVGLCIQLVQNRSISAEGSALKRPTDEYPSA